MIFGYGKETTTRIYPDGSVEETEVQIRNHNIVSTKTTYSHRVLVKTEEDILAEFIKFRKEHKRDGVSFSFDNTVKGSTYVIKSWTA